MKKISIILIFTVLLTITNVFAADDNSSNDLPFSLEEATIESIHDAIKNHQITCEELVNKYLERIKLLIFFS